eukprot:TRINITY_DN14504_c0_g1_i2.p2 TRINITY_DN14504_c0_g1~~TRINITY_DN14504_c0_g1_i2.p2  ORF type:complete len:249 (+),score=60.78 TRINITY_DN14504_c0_g1_i2:54-800(+)
MSWPEATKHPPRRYISRQVLRIPKADLARAAVLVIDVQQYCSVPGEGCWEGVARGDAPYFFDRVDSMVGNIAELLAAARGNGASDVVYTVIEALTQDGRDSSLDYKLSMNSKTHKAMVVPKGSAGAAVLPRIAPLPNSNEMLIPKTSCSVFQSTNIHYVLRNLGTRYLIVCGQLTNQCVESAVRDAADLGYFVTVVEDACAAKSPQEHAAGLFNMKGFARIATAAEVTEELAGKVLESPFASHSRSHL